MLQCEHTLNTQRQTLIAELIQRDHSPNNVKFHESTRHSCLALGMLSVTHIMPVLVLNTCMDTNMQLTINSFRQLFPEFSLTAVKFPDISRFSRQVVTLLVARHYISTLQ